MLPVLVEVEEATLFTVTGNDTATRLQSQLPYHVVQRELIAVAAALELQPPLPVQFSCCRAVVADYAGRFIQTVGRRVASGTVACDLGLHQGRVILTQLDTRVEFRVNVGQGAWVFLSHSNKDFEKVREIRNELEKRGHKPIMVYLKCLENDNALLPDLLRREIAAREWFILCDSPNARNSQYVCDEVELIKSKEGMMEGKNFHVVDLSKELQTELHKLIQISKRATVFLSYARQDQKIADRIRRALQK